MVPLPPAGQPTALQPTAVFASPQQATYLTQPQAGCDCSVPANAASSVKATRATTVAIIIVHGMALAAFGFYFIWQWIASLMVIIIGSTLLCQFNKCTYTTAAILYTIGCLFDLLAVGAWIVYAETVDDDDYYLQDDSNANDDDGGRHNLAWLALPPAICAVTLVVGSAFTFKSICKWDQSGAPGVIMVQTGYHVSHPAPAFPVVAIHHQQAPSAHHRHDDVNKGFPPGRTSTAV